MVLAPRLAYLKLIGRTSMSSAHDRDPDINLTRSLLSPSHGTMAENHHRPDSEGLQLSPEQDGPHVASAHVNRDSEGLQPVFPDPPRTYHPDSEGLQVVSVHTPLFSDGGAAESAAFAGHAGTKMPEKSGAQSWQPTGFQPGAIDVPAKRRRRRWIIIGAAIIAIVLILAAVLGGVLGSKAQKNKNKNKNASGSAPDLSAGPSSSTPSRTQSRGTWNGTTIYSWGTSEYGNSGYLTFQDYKGTLNVAPYTVDLDKFQLSLGRVSPFQSKVANNTFVRTLTWPRNGADDRTSNSIQLVYVDSDGFLAEMWQENAPAGQWTKGTLGDHRIKAPTDNRPVGYIFFDIVGGVEPPGDLGRSNLLDNSGAKLLAGGTDGTVHQYSFDRNTSTWFPNSTHTFAEAWAYGGSYGFQNVANTSTLVQGQALENKTVLLSDRNGTPLSYIQTIGADGFNKSSWPDGGSWSDPFRGNARMLPNTSFAVVESATMDPEYPVREDGTVETIIEQLIYPSASGLEEMEIKLGSLDNNGRFGKTRSSSKWGPSAMQGSDFHGVLLNATTQMIFYQPNGTTIAYSVFDLSTAEDPTQSANTDSIAGGFISLSDSNEWIVTPR